MKIAFIFLDLAIIIYDKHITQIIRLSSDWKTVIRGKYKELEMEKIPLQILTDSKIGSGDMVGVDWTNAELFNSGGLKLHFSDQIQYELTRCTKKRLPLSNVPEERKKVWTIYRTSDGLKVECNGVVVADFKITSCTHHEKWVYERDQAKIIFLTTDTASDFYRPKGSEGMISNISIYGLYLINF